MCPLKTKTNEEEIKNLKRRVKKLKRKVAVLDTEKRTLEKKRKYDFEVVKCNKTMFQFLTGLSEPDVFRCILSLIKENVPLVKKNFSYENHLLLVIMKLRLGCSNKDLAYRFELKTELVSKSVDNG